MNAGKRKREFSEKIKEKIIEEVRRKGIENASRILSDIKKEYVEGIVKYGVKDADQSWRAFKGGVLEELILLAVEDFVESENLGIIKGTILNRRDDRLDECLAKVKRSLLVDFGKFGMHLPDADLVIFNKEECTVIAILSSKATLRERVAQTGYWKLKLGQSRITEKIRVFFITLDEDQDLLSKRPTKKGRAIAEVDTDGTYVVTSEDIEESDKVKRFEKFIEDLKNIVK